MSCKFQFPQLKRVEVVRHKSPRIR